MSTRTGHRSTARRALSLGGLLLTLAGLFAMHGLAEHGTGAVAEVNGSMPTTASSFGSAAGHKGHEATNALQMVAAVPAVASQAVATSAGHGPSGGTGMVMSAVGMCVAVLLLTAIALIVHLHANRLRPLLILTARPARAPVTAGRREPDPPDLFVLSIQRC